MEKKYLETGKIVNIHGLKGEVKVMPWSDSPDFVCGFDTLYCGKDKIPFDVESARVHKNSVLIKFRGVDDAAQAEAMRNTIVYIDRDDAVLEEGVYFVQDLVGLTVQDADNGRIYGKIDDVFQTGANDVYSVKDKGNTYLIPAIPDVIIETDIQNGIMKIRPLEGLLDEN